MDFLEYSSKAIVTCRKDLKWAERLINAEMGLSGETGEFSDHLKKHLFHGHELNLEHLKKELGDILWYVNLAADTLGFELEDVAQSNIAKLYKRYKEGQFSVEQSLNRQE
jgi:NTP pyrophosphatase (non-canonical NTP hydrolase)